MSWNFFQAASAGTWTRSHLGRPVLLEKIRFQTVVKNLKAEGTIKDLKVPLDDLNYGLKIVAAVKSSHSTLYSDR